MISTSRLVEATTLPRGSSSGTFGDVPEKVNPVYVVVVPSLFCINGVAGLGFGVRTLSRAAPESSKKEIMASCWYQVFDNKNRKIFILIPL